MSRLSRKNMVFLVEICWDGRKMDVKEKKAEGGQQTVRCREWYMTKLKIRN